MNSLDSTPLLFADSSPILRYLVLTELLNKSSTDDEVKKLSSLRFEDHLTKSLFTNQLENGSWNPGIIYK